METQSWFAQNAGWIITLAVLLLSGIIWAVRQEAMLRGVKEAVEEICEKHAELEIQFQTHTKDSSSHVNHLYMRGLEQRIDRSDQAMEKNFERAFAKIDKLGDEIRRHV
jgi:hypothetical protein